MPVRLLDVCLAAVDEEELGGEIIWGKGIAGRRDGGLLFWVPLQGKVPHRHLPDWPGGGCDVSEGSL